jgi:hypothetical protein
MESTGSQRVDYKTHILSDLSLATRAAVGRGTAGDRRRVFNLREVPALHANVYHAGWGQRDAQATIFTTVRFPLSGSCECSYLAGPLSISDVLPAIVQEAEMSH